MNNSQLTEHHPSTRKSSRVKQVLTVSILMIVHGSLELAIGAFYFVLWFIFLRNPKIDWLGSLGMLAVALLLLSIGGLRVYAGKKNYGYRNRKLGLLALKIGLLPICTIYCAPTAIGLLIYGLTVYQNEEVRRAFEMGEQGATSDEILRAILYSSDQEQTPNRVI